MRLTALICLIVFVAVCFGELSDGPSREDANRLLGKGPATLYPEIQKMDQTRRIAFASYLRQEAAKDPEIRRNVDNILLFLGDETTMQKFAQANQWWMLAETKNSHAVDLIAAGLMANDDLPGAETPSYYAAQQLEVILLNWPEIPSEVSAWIKRFHGWWMNSRDSRELLREWWVANEAAWRRRDFAALKPGRDLVGRDRFGPNGERLYDRALAPAKPATIGPPTDATQSLPLQLSPARPAPEAKATTAIVRQDNSSIWPFVAVAAACVAALGAVLWFARSRPK